MDKQQLKQYRHLEREIEHLDAEMHRVLDKYLAPPVVTGMPFVEPTSSKVETAAIQRVRYYNMMQKKINDLIRLRTDIEIAIENLPTRDRDLIRLRYIEGWGWEKIAVELHRTYHHILKRHGWILAGMKGENNDRAKD